MDNTASLTRNASVDIEIEVRHLGISPEHLVRRVDRIMLYAVGESKLAKIPSNPCKR